MSSQPGRARSPSRGRARAAGRASPATTPAAATLKQIEEHAAQIAGQAGVLLLDLFRATVEVEYKDKGQRDPVSEADRKVEEYLRAKIGERFPDHRILGEEGNDAGPEGSEYTWVLDPLDGTTNFVNGLPLFAVSVGVLRWGHPAAGAIWCSLTSNGGPGVFAAHSGGGARLDGAPISVDGRAARGSKQLAHRVAAYPGNFGVMLALSPRRSLRTGDPRTLGSMAVEAALVAAGVLQSAIFWGPKIWDIAAGVTIVREAGGSALTRDAGRWHELTYFRPGTDKAGELRPLREWSAPLVVASPELATRLVEALHATPLSRLLRLTRHPVVRSFAKALRRVRALA